jgi:dipeptidase
MCDTIVALRHSTADGRTIFGKNSDRPPNEAQVIRYVPDARHDKEETVKCTYISIPQVSETYAIYLSSPHWLWGGEMGANEHGVAIGNEAVFSNEEVPETGLLGMDLLRLGLERAETARSALQVITTLLEKHGQGGICELGGVTTYHNSFLIADGNEAWVLETSDKRWVAERVDTVRAISNGYTIHTHWDFASKDLIEHAIEKGWCESKQDFDFAAAYGSETLRFIAHCDDRLRCSTELLQQKRGKLDFFEIASILRNHPNGWTPWNQETASICQHAGPASASSTTGSQISQIGDKSTHWFTGSSNPCLSVYWPFDFDTPYVYSGFGVGDKKYSEGSYWWRREKVNRIVTFKFGACGLTFPDIVKLQNEVYRSHSKRIDAKRIEMAIQKQGILIKNLGGKNSTIGIPDEYTAYWRTRNTEAAMPPE